MRNPCRVSDGVFDASVAPTYDADVAARFDPAWLDAEVQFLLDLAGGRPLLEFACGTGRVAVALAERGASVAGIELSRAMYAEMQRKPGAAGVDVTIGDMATTRVPGEFGVVLLVFNTITNLLTQHEQVQCFENAAAHLAQGGHFVIEVGLPDLQRLPFGERYVPFAVDDDYAGIDEYDVVNQMLTSNHLLFGDDGRHGRFRSHHRYAWPAEYDLMARIAGLELVERWGDWHRSPFSATSTAHVSVWRKP